MTTDKQIRANRKNAQRSTGPTTAEGKTVTSRNAVKHGLTAQKLVLYGESEAEFESFVDGLFDALLPVGKLEIILVERIVQLSWRLRRVPEFEVYYFNWLSAQDRAFRASPLHRAGPDDVLPGSTAAKDAAARLVECLLSGRDVLGKLQRYDRSLSNAFARELATLRDLQTERRSKEGRDMMASDFVCLFDVDDVEENRSSNC